MSSRLYPGAARAIIEQAIKAGWLGSFGVDDERDVYRMTLWAPGAERKFVSTWTRDGGRWKHHHTEVHENGGAVKNWVFLEDIKDAIRASVGAS